MKSKDIHIASKRDDGMAYLMERFEYSDKEALFETIRKVTPSEAEELIRKLEKKNKRLERRCKPDTSVETTEKTTIEAENQQVYDLPQEAVMQEISNEQVKQEKQNLNNVVNLEQLKIQEKELSAEVCKLEGQHKKLFSKRRELEIGLNNAVKAFEELRRILHEQEKNVTEFYNQYIECGEQMDAITQECKVYMSLLEETRRQLVELQKITILVYQDGRIEIENGKIPAIQDEEIHSELFKLVCMPEAAEITINELKAIARLQKIAKICENNGNAFELVFDNLKVQNLWQIVAL